MSYVIFSTNTCVTSARQISAPKVVVRGMINRIPPSNSAQPVKISYTGEEPIVVHKSALKDRLPTGVTSVFRGGRGNCVGMTFVIPYSNIDAASANRMNRRNHLCSVA